MKEFKGAMNGGGDAAGTRDGEQAGVKMDVKLLRT